MGTIGALIVLGSFAGRLLVWGAWLGAAARAALRHLSQHSGVPALLLAAVLLVVGFRLLKKSVRFAFEVAVVTAALVAATELGWIRW